MFITFERFVDSEIDSWIESTSAEFTEAGAVSPDLVLVPDCYFAPGSVLKSMLPRVKRTILAKRDSDYCAPMGLPFRSGTFTTDGAGAILATWMREGEKVSAIIGYTTRGILASQSSPKQLRDLAMAAEAVAEVDILKCRIEETRAHRNRFRRNSRTTGIVCRNGRARPRKAWKVPGTQEHGRDCMYHYDICRLERALAGAEAIAQLWIENPEGGAA